jgi:SAM-dependent methyltransferase
MAYDNFINIDFNKDNLDSYYIRYVILKALKDNIIKFHGTLLDVGCGKMPYKNYILQNSSVDKYIGLDIEIALEYDVSVKPDFIWDGITMPFENESFETAFGTEVLEHCPDPKIIMSEVNRVLKPGGAFFFTVPFLWPLHEIPNDEFRYTPFSLKRLLEESGFGNIDIKATGGWHASMAQMLGLWVRRAPLKNRRRKILSYFLKPVIKYLIKIDSYSNIEFKESQMITGLSGMAFKIK